MALPSQIRSHLEVDLPICLSRACPTVLLPHCAVLLLGRRVGAHWAPHRASWARLLHSSELSLVLGGLIRELH